MLNILMGFSREGLAERAVLTLSHPLCLYTALSELCAHPGVPEQLRGVTKPRVQAGSPGAI